ncbi:MAG TPA: hypothetical protein VMB21_11850 [Candidatus Limnocylindria bacterium]|jgi:hypothetical protein|nr:hypothetical protein [Candidatus Limnocylindria bacterium]
MSSSKSFLSPVTFMAAAFAFLLFLPDLDGFASGFNLGPPLISLLTSLDDIRIQTLFVKITGLVLVVLSVLCATKWLKNPVLRLFLTGTAFLVTYAWGVLLMHGLPVDVIVRTPALHGLYLAALATLVTCGLAKNGHIPAGLALGMVGAGGIRLLYSVFSYRRFGGYQIFEGTPALAMDGGALVLWAVIAVWAGLQAVQYFHRRLHWMSFMMVLVTAVFTAGVAASFRRTAMLILLGNLGLAVVIYSWFRNRLAAGILWVGGMSLAMVAGLFLVMAAVFGFTTASERVFSLGSANSANSFSNSNEAYLDDQSALKDILKGSSFLGVGPGYPYGVSRMADDFSDEGVVPLHIGTGELWASTGVVGMIYHLVFLLGLPVLCLRGYRRNPAGGDSSLVALVSSYVLFTNLWPFAPPFYSNIQASLIMGICLGYLIYIANEAKLRSLPSSERQVTPFVRRSRVNA